MPAYIVEVAIKDELGSRTFTWQGEAADEEAAKELAEGVALEEENKALRKALSEKLRAENADLRKKLGQA